MNARLEIQESVDQLAHPALGLLAARPDLFRQQGSVATSWRHRGEKRFGPYYRLRYREGGCSQSIYLGQAGPLVDRVRQTLDALQAPFRQYRALVDLERRIRDALRIDRRQLNAQLRPFGLRLKGFEVRGWRTSSLVTSLRIRGVSIPICPNPASFAKRVLASMRIRPPRLRPLRFVPRGLAAKSFRGNRSQIPRGPEARLQAVIDARRRKEQGLRT